MGATRDEKVTSKDPLRAGPSGCLLVAVALVAALGGLFVGARHGMPGNGAATKPAAPTEHSAAAEPGKKQLWTCSMHPQVIREEPGVCPICHMALVPLGAGSAGAPGTLTIDPAVVQNMGVRTALARRGAVSRELRLTGVLSEAQPKVHEINLRVAGWIEKLHANFDGMLVHAGDPLFELYSPEIHQAAGEMINAGKAGGLHLANLAEPARRKLTLWGLSKGQIDAIAGMDAAPRTVTIYSPATGHVLNKAVVEGAGVMPGQKLMDVVDHSQLWMDLTVYEADLPLVEVGDQVVAETEAHPGDALAGEVLYLLPHLDMMTRSATARIVLENPGMTYRPGMYATVKLTKEIAKDALLVPREAVIDAGARQVVFVALGEGHFAAHEVGVGAATGEGDVEITKGLEEGDAVVTSGQFLLDSESRLKEAVQKYLSGGETKAAKEEMKMSVPSAPMTASAPADAATQGEIDAVFTAYLGLQDAMAKVPHVKAPDAGPLAEAAEALVAKAGDEEKQAAEALRDAAHGMHGKEGEEAREAYKAVSGAAVALAKLHRPSEGAAKTLFEVYCSMADASWLQRTEEIANPYLEEMPTCGEVKGPIVGGNAP